MRERGLGHVTYFWNLGPPYYLRLGWSYKRQILQPDRGYGILKKIKNWAKKGRGIGHVTYFWILGPPIISDSDEATNVKFCSLIEGN